MASLNVSFPHLFRSYSNWVSSNPQIAGDVESTVKWVSYFIAGRINNSNVLSELVYSLSNLLVLFNDRIIYKTKQVDHVSTGDTLKTWLTVLEYSEVFIEVSFRSLWGERGKWIIASIVQLFKCIGRLLLLFHHKEKITQNPPIAPLKRNELTPNAEETCFEESKARFNSATFTLRRSGRVIRTVHAAPPIHCRNWKPPLPPVKEDEKETLTQLTGNQLVAETLYVIKPMVHLGSLLCFGEKAWKPWLLALGMDMASMHLYKSGSQSLSRRQRLELSRRSVALLLYLLRSPFYERHSQDRLQALLDTLAKNIPLARLICTPLAQYIPHWQDTYFYMWST